MQRDRDSSAVISSGLIIPCVGEAVPHPSPPTAALSGATKLSGLAAALVQVGKDTSSLPSQSLDAARGPVEAPSPL